ncbi:25382_t:CDS:2, partial [Gigaspora rosea]
NEQPGEIQAERAAKKLKSYKWCKMPGTYIPTENNNEAWNLLLKLRILEPERKWELVKKRKTLELVTKRKTPVSKKNTETMKPETYIPTKTDDEAWNLSPKLQILEPVRKW